MGAPGGLTRPRAPLGQIEFCLRGNLSTAKCRLPRMADDRYCWNDGGGGAGIAIADRSHCGDFQAKGAAASAALPEKCRLALLDSGKSMVQRLTSSVADCEAGSSFGLAASRLEGVLDVAIFSSSKRWSPEPDGPGRASDSDRTHGCRESPLGSKAHPGRIGKVRFRVSAR
jgi:hypothetical protein